MSEQSYAENPAQKSTFWDDAVRYTASTDKDETFVNEMAYMMVTLHRTGA